MGIRKKAQFVLIIVLMLFSLLGCRQKTKELAETKWELITLNGNNLIAGTSITLSFTEEYLGGYMGCNGYGGTPDTGKYQIKSDGTFTLGSPFAVTVQLCTEPEGIMEQEMAYIEALRSATHFQVLDDHLELKNEGGETILAFRK